ncbi:MAG: Crp/Fnr family transcriptional regulator [Candidatus Levybacteria bacterium]|nr:Crp/Fnr family transcriptional regulator [Candidatus Levybacteria bacterium]
MSEQVKNKISQFFQNYKTRIYKKGEILVRADDNPAGIFFLEKGIVKQYAISKKGNDQVVNIFKEQSYFPMSWAINETHNEYFFEAMTDLTIKLAPRDAVLTFVKDNPDVLYDLLARVYKGTDGLLTRLTYMMTGDAYARLITELLIQSKRFNHKQETIRIEFNEKDLASLTGMTRETISREMKLLKDKNLVEIIKNVIVINNLSNLENELL